jgi:hypothetical protein
MSYILDLYLGGVYAGSDFSLEKARKAKRLDCGIGSTG